MKPAYACNGQPVSAGDFYALACDPRRSVTVQACAGAGKTWMLVSRMVRALLDGAQPDEILAITFTRRAAGEMRRRLHEWLLEFSQANEQTLLEALHARGLNVPNGSQAASEQRKLLSNLYQQLIDGARPVQVRTFHGWFSTLLRNAPLALLHQLGLPADYELIEDESQAQALVWRPFYRSLLEDAAARADFDSLVADYGRAQTIKALQVALSKNTEFALADAAGALERAVPGVGEQYPQFAGFSADLHWLRGDAARWQSLHDAAQTLSKARARTHAEAGAALQVALDGADLAAMRTALFTQSGTPRRFSESLPGLERVRLAQDVLQQLFAAQRQYAAWHYQERLARLARLLLRCYAQLKQERGWIGMNDLERAALVLLSDPVLAGWVQERLDARVRHLLIDEFQDTSPLQWQALQAWLSAYAGAGAAPSVFIVGDPKQSIYRFRRAEPQVFEAAQVFVQEALGGCLLSCDHTRRNTAAVLDCVNATFQAAAAHDGFAGFRTHTTSVCDAGQVLRLPVIARTPKALEGAVPDGEAPRWRDSLTEPRALPQDSLRLCEARQAARWIAQELAGGALRPEHFMVLARKRVSLVPMQEALRQLGVPVQLADKTQLTERCEVQDLVALLDALVSPQHDLSLARALRSPLFGVHDDALVQLADHARRSNLCWFDALQKLQLSAPDGRAIAPTLLRWQLWLRSLPPHDALQALYVDGDVLGRFGGAAPPVQRAAVLANLQALLTLALQREGGRYATPYALVRALKAQAVQAPATLTREAVQLLTVHGAKGLEAHTVLLLDTDAPPRNAQTMTVLVDWQAQRAAPGLFLFLASENEAPASAEDVLQREQMQRHREELNALYVALTRASHRVVISSSEPARKSSAGQSWWQRLQDRAEAVLPESLRAGAAPAPASPATHFELPQHLTFNQPVEPVQQAQAAIKKVAQPVHLGLSGADSVAARLGRALHRLLEWGALTDAACAAVAQEFALNQAQAQHAAAMARAILQGQARWAWDEAEIGWGANEVELVHAGELLRIDRLVYRKAAPGTGTWWVLDYKSAHAPQHEPALCAQLLQYRAAVQALYPQQSVRCAFLNPAGDFLEVHAA